MVYQAIAGYPALFGFSSVGSSGTYTTVAGITRIGAMTRTRKVSELDLLYTSDNYDEAIAVGIVKHGSVKIDGVYLTTSGTQTGIILDALNTGNRIGWKFALSTALSTAYTCFYGDGYVEAYEIGEMAQDKVMFSCTIKPTGKPTIGSSTT
jgi:hypothetical protein